MEDISFILLGGYSIYPPWRIFHLSSVEDISFILLEDTSFILLEDILSFIFFNYLAELQEKVQTIFAKKWKKKSSE